MGNYPEDAPFLLVHGDLSGTQEFIKSVPGKGAAKSLKGRSVYLSLLMEVVARHLVNSLKLSLANILYTGGGNFFLLAPASKRAQLERLRHDITQVLLKAHSGEIALSLGWVDLPIGAFFNGKQMKEHFRDASEAAGQLKAKRFSELGLSQQFDEIFTPSLPSGVRMGTCAGCRQTRHIVNDEEHLCSMCESYKSITSDLKTASFLTFTPCNPFHASEFKDYSDVFKAFGYDVAFVSQPLRNSKGINLRLNSTELSADWEGFYFLPVALPLKEDGQTLKGFEALAEESEGDELLGWIKLDVDNLGAIFKDGLADTDYTLSRIITLNRLFTLFFCVLVPQVCGKDLYLVYSGGDDTLALGPWNIAWERLCTLRENFQMYVCKHPLITFSAAFQALPPKYPVTRAMDELEELLAEAKSSAPKNRVSVLSIPLSWFPHAPDGDELSEMLDIVALCQVDEKRGLHLARRLLRLTSAYLPALRWTLRGSAYPSRIWRFAYFLRHERRETRESLYRKYEELAIANLLNRRARLSPLIFPVAARLVEMKYRRK